ncbi:signal peptidase II [Aliikangiella maris]|uniref:Lipoprotein signal peptidase n=2 Tax=Aliikangiella maris TaxID=3162458 RepID=A0ABV3MHT7_9GAMM
MPDNASQSIKLLPLHLSGLRWIWLTAIFIALDQWTKYLAQTYIGEFETIEVMPYFNLVLRYNTGAAFSLFADQGGWQVAFFSIVATVISLGIIFWMWTTPAKNKILGPGLALILAGAIGNLYDRLTLGKVVDFIDWYYADYHWPAFNIADSVILLGAILMLLDGYFHSKESKSND